MRQPTHAPLPRPSPEIDSDGYYPAAAATRYRCKTVLLVLCPHRTTARWAQRLSVSRQSEVTPWIVIGPDQISADPNLAGDVPERAVLATITHGRRDPGPYAQVLNDALLAVDATDPELARLYTDLVAVALPRAAVRILEELMSTTTTLPSWSQRLEVKGEARGRAEGQARGRAESLLAVLNARQLSVTAAQTKHILACTDIDQLDTWTRRAITTPTTNELLNS